MDIFNNPDFYPTPEDIIYQMIEGLNLKGKYVLDGHAGKGDILGVCKMEGANTLACEIHPDLSIIAAKKSDYFICDDFFNVQSSDISHIDYMILNPPFKNADEHILHAIKIAPDGCQIISLANFETVDNPYSRNRKVLKSKIEKLGSLEYLGTPFDTAERKTNIEVVMIKIFIPKAEGTDEFADFMFSAEEEQEILGIGDGVVKFSRIREIVGRYIQSVKMFDSFMSSAGEINAMMKPLGGDFKIQFDTRAQRGNHYSNISRDEFKAQLQKSSWLQVMKEMNMGKYLTKRLIDQLNAKIQKQTNQPFTERNIYKVMEAIVGTHGSRMNEVLIEVFDWLTERHHENRHNLEGWKTNSMYFVGEKFIAPYSGVTRGYSGGHPEIRWSDSGEKIDEMVKSLCSLTGTNFDECILLRDLFTGKKVPNDKAKQAIEDLMEATGMSKTHSEYAHDFFKYFCINKDQKLSQEKIWRLGELGFVNHEIDKIVAHYLTKDYNEKYFGEQIEYKEWGKWYDFNFFKVKVYKKGTLHAQFKDKKVWEMFNREAAKAKGWQLPERTGSDYRRKTADVTLFN